MIFSKLLRLKSLILISITFLVSCHPQVDLKTLNSSNKDLQKIENYPSGDELFIPKREIILRLIERSGNIDEQQVNEIYKQLEEVFEDEGDFFFLPKERVKKILESEDYKNVKPKNIADYLQFGASLEVGFVSQYSVIVVSQSYRDGVNYYQYEVTINILSTDTKQTVLSRKFIFDTSDKEDFKKEIKEMVQENFPLKGFIIESRGNSQVVKITIGKSSNLKKGRELTIHQRLTKEEVEGLKGSKKSIILDKKNYSEILAKGELIHLEEDTAWIFIPEGERSKIQLGQVIFTLPE